MSTTQPQTPQFPPFNEIGARTLDAVSALTEAGHRVGGQLIELWSSAAGHQLRTLAELQSAAVESARGALPSAKLREAFEEFRQDPVAWYRKTILSMFDGTQRVFKLIETNAQIASRDAERLQGAADRASQQIENAVSTCASRLRELYAART